VEQLNRGSFKFASYCFTPFDSDYGRLFQGALHKTFVAYSQ